ncbi:hypothetical protein IVB69_09800 [Flavobacterium sp. J49]|uniref:carboxypeptidase-like regulatory domain-containing protein n=1 Tax=Flavobacterium sp. J49 TaxID=2718534 RepID=UPI001593514C|nr:hypothetical protein [Flavobacterium sp. J49]MBF6641774.1 hypothetical protein [Flavobacterium sp. J49]NIC03021.1 hypothetical protein [Flavobacterium sp. J49]
MAKITYWFFILFPFLGFAQSEKLLHGKVLSEGKSISNVDIVNTNSKKSSTTDSNGNFSILAKTGDELFIISKEYVDRKIVVTQEQLDQTKLLIYLEEKPIALEDVEILKKSSLKIEVKQSDIDAIKLAKQANALKVQNVYDGTIENGIDFVRMAKGLRNLFKNKDREKREKSLPPIPFKDYLDLNFDTAFYTQKLKLKPEEIELFIAYCEVDSRAKSLAEQRDLLEMADFLFEKNEAFKKLER